MSLKRRADILGLVRASGSFSVTALAKRLEVSTETIRRNIQALIEEGSVVRFHGGIMIPDRSDEPPFQRRMQVQTEAKRRIGALVAERIADGDSLILDNGTTSAWIAEALSGHSRLTVVTHSVEIAWRLAARNGNRVFIAGGELGTEDASTFGTGAIEFVRQFQVRVALLSVGGIGRTGDLGDFHLFEADFARAAMRQAQETWIVADASKFGREAPVQIGPLAKVDRLICDIPPPPPYAALCAEGGVNVVNPDVEG